MQQTPMLIGLNIQKPVQEMEQPKAELNLRQEPTVLEIRQPPGTLSIDSSRARYNIGLRTSMEFSDANAQRGVQSWLEAISQSSSEGDRLAAIEQGGNAIADIAFERGLESNPPDTPVSGSDEGVDISYQPGKVEINIERRGMRMDPVLRPPILQYTPGKVEGYVRQWNKVNIEVVGLHVNRTL
ncbi:DUF6470 family protein [Brevibacillus sp. B_LB10_24]|uniref:DUF6470 family protein n=1 Tax=Brevibacillus sp. B_LB10_24 TaxID=3380645 RepID=UPI0038BB7207